MEKFIYNGIEYQIRSLEFNGDMYNISTTALNDLIQSYPKNKKLSNIDDSIIYYCDNDEMNLTDKELINIIFN